jgi:hypothetical protein
MKTAVAIWANLAWFGCVFAAMWGRPSVALLIAAGTWGLLAWRGFITRDIAPRLLVLALVGIVFDGIAHRMGLIRYPNLPWFQVPIWIVGLWLHFAALIPFLREVVGKSIPVAAVLGAILGPLSYQSGARFGVMFLEGNSAFLIYGLFWALFFPSSLILSARKTP